MALEVIIDFLTRGGSNVKRDLHDTEEAIEGVERAGDGAGRGLDEGANSALLFNERMESLAQSGEFLSGIGEKASAMANSFADASQEASGVQARFESILKQQGRAADMGKLEDIVLRVRQEGNFADDEELKNNITLLNSFGAQTEHVESLLRSSARQARTMGTSLDSVSVAMGKAYSSGNIGALARSGLAFSEQEKKAVKAAYAISQAAGQMKFMEVVTKAVERNTVGLGDSLTDAQKKANNFAYEWGEMEETLGKGSETARANVQGILASVVQLAGANPQIIESAGAWLYYGGQAATAGGSLLQIAGNAGMAVQGLSALKVASIASMGTLASQAGIAGAALAAIVLSINDINNSLGDMTMGEDEYVKKRGRRGEWEDENAASLADTIGKLNPHLWRGADAEAAATKGFRERQKRIRNRTSRSAGGGTKVKFSVDDLDIPNPLGRSAAKQ